jgi:hypothetical protein
MTKNTDGTGPTPGQTLVYYIGVGGARVADTTEASTSPCTSRCFWLLVRDRGLAPDRCICPSSGQTAAADPNPMLFHDFPSGKNLSYGIQVPFGSKGKPTTEREIRMPLLADRGWFGAAQETGLPSPGDPVGVSAAKPPRGWRRWNSPNHGGPGNGEGQNVMFADFHAEFDKRPLAGIDLGNIYTSWAAANANEEQRVRSEMEKPIGGRRPGYVAPYGDTDTVIYP